MGDFSMIESVLPPIDDILESASEIFLIENFPGLERPAVMAEDRLRGGKLTNQWVRGNRFGKYMARRKAVSREVYGRSKDLSERKGAIFFMGRKPTVNQRRHRDRQHALHRYPLPEKTFAGRRAGSSPGGVDYTQTVVESPIDH